MVDKSALILGIRTFRAEVLRELDRLEDIVMRLSDSVSEETPAAVHKDNEDWLTVKEVCAALKISDATFYAGIKDGKFPPGVAFSPKSKRWKISQIIEWQKTSRPEEDQPKRRGRVSKIRRLDEFYRKEA